MKMKKTLSTCFIMLLFLGGCATWVMVGGNYENSAQNFKAEFPNGWRKFNLSKDEVLITKDGFSLHFIRISRSPVENKLKYTENGVEYPIGGKFKSFAIKVCLLTSDSTVVPVVTNMRIIATPEG